MRSSVPFDSYRDLRDGYGFVGSWALWGPPAPEEPKREPWAHTRRRLFVDLSFLQATDAATYHARGLDSRLNRDVVLLALNFASRNSGYEEFIPPFYAFHSRSRSDRRLADAVSQSSNRPLHGAYITDLVKVPKPPTKGRVEVSPVPWTDSDMVTPLLKLPEFLNWQFLGLVQELEVLRRGAPAGTIDLVVFGDPSVKAVRSFAWDDARGTDALAGALTERLGVSTRVVLHECGHYSTRNRAKPPNSFEDDVATVAGAI